MIKPDAILRKEYKVHLDKFTSPFNLDDQINNIIPYLQKRYELIGTECEVYFNFQNNDMDGAICYATFFFYNTLMITADSEQAKA